MLSRRALLRGIGGGLALGCMPPWALANTVPCGGRTLSTSDFNAFRNGLSGELLSRGSNAYDQARRLYNLRFDPQPLMVVQPRTGEDVAAALGYARQAGLPWAVKSGGHSYIGASGTNGLMLDMALMRDVSRVEGGLYRIGPGARLKTVYSSLSCDGWTIPSGSCDTVGFGGVALGGGVGYLMREHGLTIDRIRAMNVVLADGRQVIASPTVEPDLFWALRGAGGGNFGVVTAFDVEPVPLRTLALKGWRWSWSQAVAGFMRWQQVLADGLLPRDCVSYISFSIDPSLGQPSCSAGVISSASQPALDAAAELFIGSGGVASWGATFGWVLNSPTCNAIERSEARRYKAKSAMLYAPMSEAGVEAIKSGMQQRFDDPRFSRSEEAAVVFLSLGGAVSDVGSTDTAFSHRGALADVQYLAYWNSLAASAAEANLGWIRSIWSDSFPHVSAGGAGCYVNYCDDDLPAEAWPSLYYGMNLPRLQQVKAAYDPTDFFRGSQTVRLS